MNSRFEAARYEVMYSMKQYAGFGTYGEKSVHAVLKKYLEPNTDFHEVGVCGSIADICKDGLIYEIQTRSTYKLKPKLEKFLPTYKVCVVIPITVEKTIYSFDPQNLGRQTKRKSPLKGSVYDFLPMIYPLRDFIFDTNLSFKIMLIKVSEYRALSAENSKRRTVKFDTVPDELVCEINIAQKEDYLKLVPMSLPERFDSVDYAKTAHILRSDAQISLNMLSRCGIVEKIDKKGHTFIYRIIE